MDKNSQQSKIIPIPKKLFKSMIETHQKWERFSNELEDFLLSNDEQFIQKMRKARKEHQAGETNDLEVLKQKL